MTTSSKPPSPKTPPIHVGSGGLAYANEVSRSAMVTRTIATTGRIKFTRGSLDQRSEEHTSELQSQSNLVCRLLLEKKKVMGENEKASAIVDYHNRLRT